MKKWIWEQYEREAEQHREEQESDENIKAAQQWEAGFARTQAEGRNVPYSSSMIKLCRDDSEGSLGKEQPDVIKLN